MPQYKVTEVAESGLSVIFLGSSSIPLQRMEMEINNQAAQGWVLDFQVMEKKRFLLFWSIDRVILTFRKD